MVEGVLVVSCGVGLLTVFLLGCPEAEEGGESLVEVSVVASGVAGKLREHLGGIDQFAVAEGITECDRAVVGVRCWGVRVALWEEGLGNRVVRVVHEAGLEYAEAVAAPGGCDHVVHQRFFQMADGLEFAVVAAGVADELVAILAGEEDFVGEFPMLTIGAFLRCASGG